MFNMLSFSYQLQYNTASR